MRTDVLTLWDFTCGVVLCTAAPLPLEVLSVVVLSVTVVSVTVVSVTLVVLAGDVSPDVLTTQLDPEMLFDVHAVVVPPLVVLLLQVGAVLSVAVQLPLELLLSVVEAEVLLLDVQVVVVPVVVVLTVQPAGTFATLGEAFGLLDDDRLPLELNDEWPLLELDDPPLLEWNDPPLELEEE